MSKYQDYFNQVLKARKLTQVSLSEIVGLSTAKVNQLVKSEKHLTLELYDELVAILELTGTEKKFFEPYLKNLKEDRDAKRALAIICRHFDLSLLKKELNLKNINNPVDIVKGILTYFNTKNIEQFEKIIPKKIEETVVVARQWQRDIIEPSSANLYIFCKQCDEKIAKMNLKDLPKYSESKLQALADKAHTYTTKGKDGFLGFLKELRDCGVMVIEQKHLPKTYINAIVYLHKKTPVIVLTYRLAKLDQVWFALIHEIGHIRFDYDYLKNKGLIIHEEGTTSNMEDRAEEFARRSLKIPQIVKEASLISRTKREITEQDITKLSKQFSVGDFIVVGCIQYAKLISYTHFNNLKNIDAPRVSEEGL